MPRLAVLTSHPIQYLAPFFRQLAACDGLETTVLYSSTLGVEGAARMENFGRSVVWNVDLLEGYDHKFLPCAHEAHPQRRWSMTGKGLAEELSRGSYELVVNFGWSYPVDWLSFVACRRRRIPFLLYGDTDVRDRGGLTSGPLRPVVMGGLCRAAAGALYTGTFNRDFYIHHGIEPTRLWFSPWAVDNARFGAASREIARAKLGLRDATMYLLFVGTLIARKRPLDVLEALARLQARGRAVGAIFAGTGELEDEVRATILRRELRDVHLLGFVNQTALPEIYAGADAFVLPSDKDPRATVVNEAMAAGLPVIVSTGTGVWGPGDLVRHGREGLVFAPRDLIALTDACEQLTGPDTRRRMGEAARERVGIWSYETAIRGWQEAAHAVLGAPAGGSSPPGSVRRVLEASNGAAALARAASAPTPDAGSPR